MVWLESEVDLTQLVEAADEQTCTGHEHERCGNLCNNEQIAKMGAPRTATGFVLEYTESLQNPVWTPVVDPPIVFGAQKTVTIVPGAGARFYRLHQP